MLDEVSLDMFRRAQPFSQAPDEAKGDTFVFVQNISFDGHQPPVDVELVIAADTSFSMGRDDLLLRREAYARAIGSDEFGLAVKAGRLGRIAVTYFEWAAPNEQKILVPRREIDGPDAAAAFAAGLREISIVSRSRSSISRAIEFAMTQFRQNHSDGARRVLDIFADGPNKDGGPVLSARDAALAVGIAVNGVTMMFPGPNRPQVDIDRLDDYFADCVAGGQGSFVLPVRARESLEAAIRTALVSDITGRVPEQAQIPSSGQDKRVSCRKGEEERERVWPLPRGDTTLATGLAAKEKPSSETPIFATSKCFERLRYRIYNPIELSANIGPDGMIVGRTRLASHVRIEDVRADVNAANKILYQCPPYTISSVEAGRRGGWHRFSFGDAKLASESVAEIIRANFRKCWKPERTGPAVWLSLDYKPDGTYQRRPMLINPQDTEEYARAAAGVTAQVNKCPPVKFGKVRPLQSINWQFHSDESARTSRPNT